MTDSIKACVDLRLMATDARRQVEVHYAQTKNKHDQDVGARYAKPIKATSPMSGTGMMVATYWNGDRPNFLQSQVVADLNIPNALTGHNCEHGTSVFAAGVAALELLKHWMVREGVPRNEVDKLSSRDVTLHGATVTFLLDCETEDQARRNVKAMKEALLLLGHKPTGHDSTNETFYVKRKGYVVTVYHKTNFAHCRFPPGADAEALMARARCLIRIEVYMQGNFLRDKGWDQLESWRGAYGDGRYKTIFDNLVRNLFRFDVVLRQRAPRADVMQPLTPTCRAIVEAYLAGTPVDDLPSIRDSTTADAHSKIKSKWRARILKKLSIDITIPWKQHQQLRHNFLNKLVEYPGDYHPCVEAAQHIFCEESWPALLQRIKDLPVEGPVTIQ
jgi:hypothetical protein